MSRLERDLKNQLSKIPDRRRTEIESHLALFKKFDSDGDGRLSHEEFSKLLFELNSRPVSGSHLRSPMGSGQDLRSPTGQDLRNVDLSTFPDCDEDGFVSALEFLAFVREIPEE